MLIKTSRVESNYLYFLLESVEPVEPRCKIYKPLMFSGSKVESKFRFSFQDYMSHNGFITMGIHVPGLKLEFGTFIHQLVVSQLFFLQWPMVQWLCANLFHQSLKKKNIIR